MRSIQSDGDNGSNPIVYNLYNPILRITDCIPKYISLYCNRETLCPSNCLNANLSNTY